MQLDTRLPPDFPILADRPVWLFLLLLLAGMTVLWTINNLYFGWLHRRAPEVFRPRVLLALVVVCIAVAAIGIVTNPPLVRP